MTGHMKNFNIITLRSQKNFFLIDGTRLNDMYELLFQVRAPTTW